MAKKTSHSDVRNGRGQVSFLAKKKSAKDADDVISARRQQVEAALGEIVETIEKYFLVTPFEYIDSRREDRLMISGDHALTSDQGGR